MHLSANIVSIFDEEIFYGTIEILDQKILKISKISPEKTDAPYIMPGFTDAHIHIESSMLVPSEFARMAVVHGTVATVSDPHEIANVLGIEGVRYMIENGKKVPLKFNFGAPSCVPATTFESAGAVLDAAAVKQLLEMPEIRYLSEMMNYPGVIYDDPEVMKKIQIAHELCKPVDGHAPGLRGDALKKYIAAGISTDHECFTYEEGLEKLQLGMKVIIREGSAAKNFKALIDLLPQFPDRVMFCSDDKHPDDLAIGHINQLAARAVAHGCPLFDVLKAACVNPVEHYDLEVGLLREGDWADFILVENLSDFKVLATYINGEKVAENGKALFQTEKETAINQFNTHLKTEADFALPAKSGQARIIRALNGEIVTESFVAEVHSENGFVQTDTQNDILKIAVVNRYRDEPPALALIRGFGLKTGALASCVGHDSHNIIAVGTNDAALCRAVNLVIENKGGISAVGAGAEMVLPLPVAGIMSNEDGYRVAEKYAAIDHFVKNELACTLTAPFMTLSFMALLVIPQLKLSDKGLFDGEKFQFTPLFV